MRIDLLGVTPDSSGDSDSPLQVWQNVWNASSSKPTLFNMYETIIISAWKTMPNYLLSEDAPFKGQQCIISNPHSNAVIDLDGDCLAGMQTVFQKVLRS
jgi:integrin alpha FG-GAP repeat containing protein 1